MGFTSHKELHYIPKAKGASILGTHFDFVKRGVAFLEEQRAKQGDIFFLNSYFFPATVIICGPTANKFLLVDNAKFTSNKEAWETALGELFPNGLMLMDGEQHQHHRNIMLDAFKKEPMQGYLDILPQLLEEILEELKGKSKYLFFPFFKRATLKIAAKIFFGLDSQKDLHQVNKAITNIVKASISIPVNLPFTTYGKGIRGRAFLVKYFQSIIAEKRAHTGSDLFSKFCQATNEEGEKFTDQEIIDHLIFILMASHDTTAITMSLMSYHLAKYPEWQDKVHSEIKTLNKQNILQTSDLRQLQSLDLVMKETMRLYPPLTVIGRKTEKDMEFKGIRLPQSTAVNVVVQMSHTDPETWSASRQFDPERFNKERREHQRCPFAYAPFGAGPHHCIGYGFADMVVKRTMMELISEYELSVTADYECPIRDIPLQQPTDNLPIFIKRRGDSLL